MSDEDEMQRAEALRLDHAARLSWMLISIGLALCVMAWLLS